MTTSPMPTDPYRSEPGEPYGSGSSDPYRSGSAGASGADEPWMDAPEPADMPGTTPGSPTSGSPTSGSPTSGSPTSGSPTMPVPSTGVPTTETLAATPGVPATEALRTAASGVPTRSAVPTDPPPPPAASAGVEGTQADAIRPRGIRMRTVVLGLVLLVIAGAVAVSRLTDISVDPGAVLLSLMLGGGLLLVVAGLRRT